MSYRTWVRVGPDGTVNSHIVTAGPVPEGYFEITDPLDIRMIQRGQNRALYDSASRRFIEKRRLRFVPERYTFLADGIDILRVNIVGDIGGKNNVRVLIGARPGQVVLVPAGEPLELVTTTPGRIGIRLQERLLLADPLVVLAEDPGGGA